MIRRSLRACPNLILVGLLSVFMHPLVWAQDTTPSPTTNAAEAPADTPAEVPAEVPAETSEEPLDAPVEAVDGSADPLSSEGVQPSAAEVSHPPSPLAGPQWRGYAPRWIGLYGSQLADLVPESFRPISINDLGIALRDDALQLQPPSEMPVSRLMIVARAESDHLVSLASQLALPESPEGIQADDRGPSPSLWQRYRLGELNLNLVQPLSDRLTVDVAASAGAQQRIVSDAAGNCFAWGPPGAKIDFDWSARCQHTPEGRQWTLQLPDATITRFFLGVAASTELKADGGSLTKLAHTPPWDELGLDPAALEQLESDPSDDVEPTVWYAIEPSPGQPLVLRQQPTSDGELGARSMSVVRGCHFQSRWMGDQLRWTCRMTLDASSSNDFSELAWADGEVTAVRRDDIPVPFVWTGDSVRWVPGWTSEGQSDVPSPGEIDMTSTTWVMEGVSYRRGDRVPLPRPLLPADLFVLPPQTWHMQLDVPSWSVLSDAQLPPEWNLRRLPSEYTKPVESLSQRSSDDDFGQDVEATPSATWMASGPAPTSDTPWSVSILQNDALVFADHQMRFEMDESSIQARGKITVEMPRGSLGPVTFELQDGFQFEFIGVGEGRRSVPTGTAAGHGRRLIIWPGGDEVIDNRMVVYVSGRARRTNIAGQADADSALAPSPAAIDEASELPATAVNEATGHGKPDRGMVPNPLEETVLSENRAAMIDGEANQRTEALWLMRAVNCPGQLLATIVPPAGLSWSAKAAIEPSRIAFPELSAAQRRFFAPLPGDAIVFGGAIEATPEVTLEKPDVNLSVSLRTLLRAAPSGTDTALATQRLREATGLPSSKETSSLWQTLELKTEGTAGEIRSVRLRFAARPLREEETVSAHRRGTDAAQRLDDHGIEPSTADGVPPPWEPMQWFVQLQPGQSETPLAQHAVTRHYIESAGDWEVQIALPPQFTNQSLLVGRRRLKTATVGSAVAIGLPNVPDAASQSAEIWIDSSLQLKDHPEPLKGIPLVDSSYNGPRGRNGASYDSDAQGPTRKATTARYRYAPNDQPWIEVLPRSHRSPTGLVVSQRLIAESSVCGTDTLRMTCLVRSDSEILLSFPPSLHLVDLRCDDVLVTPRVVLGRGIVIPAPATPPSTIPADATSSPRSTTTTGAAADASTSGDRASRFPNASSHWRRVEANWVSQAPRSNWYRWYQFPEITLNQLVVDTRHELLAANGTRIFQIPDFARPWYPSAKPLLLPSGFMAGLGWIAALILLGLACLVGRGGLRVLGVGIVLTVVAVVLWPAAAIPLMTFVALPLTLAAIQLTTTLWRRDSESKLDVASVSDMPSRKDASHSRPMGAANASLLIALAFTLAGSCLSDSRLAGQDTTITSVGTRTESGAQDGNSEEQASTPTIDILVPLQNDGRILGNKIYIPESFYNDLYFSRDHSSWQNPMIDRVSYRLQLTSPLESGRPMGDTDDFLSRNTFENEPLNRGQARDGKIDIATITDEMLSQRGTAALQVRLDLTLPPSVRRIQLPYQFEQISSVVQISSTDDPMTVRWGGEKNGRAWVEIPTLGRDAERVTLVIALRCQLSWQSPWVTVSCDLPPLPAADLVVSTHDAVENVMLLAPTTSWFVDFPSNAKSDPLQSPANPTAPVVVSGRNERESNVIPFGSERQLNLRFQLRASTITNIGGSEVTPADARSDVAQHAPAIDESTLPWYDETQWQQRFWVHSERGKTVIECELESLRPLPPEVVLSLATTAPQAVSENPEDDPAATRSNESASTPQESQPCALLGTQWACLSRDDGDPADVQTMRLMSLATPTRSIRLAWTLPTPREGAWRIRMPRVVVRPTPAHDKVPQQSSNETSATAARTTQGPIASADAGNTNAATPASDQADGASASLPWIAWTFADDVLPDWSTMGEVEPLSVDQFYAKWTGYLSEIDRAAIGNVQELRLKQANAPSWEVATRHEISIQPNVQRVRFLVHVTTSDEGPRRSPQTSDVMPSTTAPTVGATRYMVQLPDRARLLDWRFEADGSPAISPHTPSSDLPAAPLPAAPLVEEKGTGADDADDAAVSAVALAPPPWTVTRQAGTTTLYLTTDHRSFNIVVDAIVPHVDGEEPGKLGLMSISKLAAAPSSEANQSGDSAVTAAQDWARGLQQSNELQITRNVDTIVNWVHPVSGKRMDTGGADAASLLADGEILVDRFQSTGSSLNAFASGRFHAHTNEQPFDVDSRVTLRWEEGRWTAQTDCQITSSYCPDYLDIALPTRWCESLRIDPLCVSSRQPTLDPAVQVLRLQLRHDSVEGGTNATQRRPGGSSELGDAPSESSADSDPVYTRTFRLISRLAVSEITRVSVPELRIMDARQHRIDVVVPTRLTNEQVRWRSNFAGPIEKPRWRLQPLPAGSSTSRPPTTALEAVPDTELSVYAVTSPRWSIDLETLPRTDRVARLLHTDHCVIAGPANESLLMVSRFDVLPGDQPSLRLAIDPGVELQGVWAATRQADLQGVPVFPADQNSREDEDEAVVWEISLPLSRLSQTVEVVTALRREVPDVLLPSLTGLRLDAPRASVNWCQLPTSDALTARSIDEIIGGQDGARRAATPFHNDARAASLIASPLTPQTRVAWLASNVVKAIRASSDSLADRRDDEVAVWLKPWIARYQMLCHSAGRQLGDDDPTDTELSAHSQSSRSAGIPAGDLLSWKEMDAFIVAQETRYFPGNALAGENASITWSDYLAITKPPGYADRWTFAWSGRRLPIQLLAAEHPSVSEQTRQLVMRSGLFFVVASLLVLAALIPRRSSSPTTAGEAKPATSWGAVGLHPSLWLLVLSIIGLVLVPLPMALGLLVVALILGASHAKRWLLPQWRVSRRKGSHS